MENFERKGQDGPLQESLQNLPEKVRVLVSDGISSVAQRYPGRIQLHELNFAIRESEEMRGLIAAYDVQKHVVYVGKDFTVNYEKTHEDSKIKLEAEQMIVHELMHSISFRKVEERGPYVYVMSGVQLERGNKKDWTIVDRKRKDFNEFFTNYFAFKIMRDKSHDGESQKILEYSLQHSVGIVFGDMLESIVGVQTLERAYFEGDTEGLFAVIDSLGINSRKLFSSIERGDFDAAIKMISKKSK